MNGKIKHKKKDEKTRGTNLQTQHENTHALGKFYFYPHILGKERSKDLAWEKEQLRYSTTWCFNFVTFSVGAAAAVYISQTTNTI